MSNQIGKNNRENSRLNYLGSHIPQPKIYSRGRNGNRSYVFVSGRVNEPKLESVESSSGFYRRLERNIFRQ